MQMLAVLFSLLPLAALAGSADEPIHGRRSAHRHVSRNQTSTGRRGTTYTLTDKYQGQTFFDDWNFDTFADPTHGMVNFLDKNDAMSQGLAYVQSDNTAVIGVDSTTWLGSGQNRNSVRISSQKTYNGGLFIADFWAMPHGCGAWPAYWMVGPNWPAGGEIDIVEGVHNSQSNELTLHTSDGCNLDTKPSPLRTSAAVKSGEAFTSYIASTECASSNANNAGCGFTDPNPASFGHGFNIIAGGVYAMLWDSNGIAVWHFERSAIPADIGSGNPDPTSWPTPTAFWSSNGCDMASHFYDQQIVLDITLCGDWAGAVYGDSGCPGTCADAVADPSNFKNAQFKVNYIAVYN
jgi:hypothetical protein